jgi:hypothetical protein
MRRPAAKRSDSAVAADRVAHCRRRVARLHRADRLYTRQYLGYGQRLLDSPQNPDDQLSVRACFESLDPCSTLQGWTEKHTRVI